MTQETTQLLEHALELPLAERELLAIELMTHLHESSDNFAAVETAWHAEIGRRAASSDAGDGGSVPFLDAWPRIIGKHG